MREIVSIELSFGIVLLETDAVVTECGVQSRSWFSSVGLWSTDVAAQFPSTVACVQSCGLVVNHRRAETRLLTSAV